MTRTSGAAVSSIMGTGRRWYLTRDPGQAPGFNPCKPRCYNMPAGPASRQRCLRRSVPARPLDLSREPAIEYRSLCDARTGGVSHNPPDSLIFHPWPRPPTIRSPVFIPSFALVRPGARDAERAAAQRVAGDRGGGHTLILAPTGPARRSPRSLGAQRADRRRTAKAAAERGADLYISPLKALGNDIHRNLERRSPSWRSVHGGGRDVPRDPRRGADGDTRPSARARMLRKSPHILITTPESLQHPADDGARARDVPRRARGDRRRDPRGGRHEARRASRADPRAARAPVAGDPPQRIGLSATQRPLEEIARFLGGMRCRRCPRRVAGLGRDKVVDCGLVKPMELVGRSPVEDLAQGRRHDLAGGHAARTRTRSARPVRRSSS